jgi:hypothetical protein
MAANDKDVSVHQGNGVSFTKKFVLDASKREMLTGEDTQKLIDAAMSFNPEEYGSIRYLNRYILEKCY